MRAVVQRVSQSAVAVDGEKVGSIGPGLLVLLGVAKGDAPSAAAYLAEKITNVRILEVDNHKKNRSLKDIQGEMLVVSQFTLMGDCRKGRRPSFIKAAPPEIADRLYLSFVDAVRNKGLHVETGQFQAMMAVELINDGPVTLVLESPGESA